MGRNLTGHTRSLKRYHRLILSVLVFCISLQAKPQQYNLREFPDGLAQPYVYSLIQDSKGYLWIGTGNGLSRYDGFTFKTYTTSDSLADNFITCSFKNEGDLWFGHMNGKITHYNGKIFKPVITGEMNSSITDIEKSPAGVIWAGTNSNGLIKLQPKPGDGQKNISTDHIPVSNFQFLTEDELLIGSVNGLDYCHLNTSGKIENIRHLSEIPDSKIQDIIKSNNGSVFYIATENEGIFQLSRAGNKFILSKLDIESNITGVQRILEDSKSNLWVSTFGNGLIKLENVGQSHFRVATSFNKSTGSSTDDVKFAYEDREGNIWSGNYGSGLTQITRKAFASYTFDKSRYGNDIYSICFLNNYRWLGTDKGLLKLKQSTGEILKFYTSGSGLPKDKITAIASSGTNELWIGTEGNGVFRMRVDQEKIIPVSIAKGTLENSVTTIAATSEQVWIGTRKGVCNIKTGSGAMRWYTMDNGELPHNYVNHLLLDSKSRLWISTLSNILVYLQNGMLSKDFIASEKGISALGPMIIENDSTIWVGSNGNGVFRNTTHSVTNLTSKDGLFSDYCYSLIIDNTKNIWVSHRGGLSKIRTSDNFIKPIQQNDGIKSSCEFNPNAVWKDDKNRIWFGTNQGLLVFDPALDNQELIAPVLNITSCKVNDNDIDYSEKLTLSPGNYKIKIEFIGINLKDPALVNYQYQLEGYDNAVVNTKTGSITFPRLTDGVYTLNLWAINGEGVKTEMPLTFQIIIKKPLWKQWWFVGTMALLLILSFIIYIRRRDYRHLIEKRMLEAKVQERTLEISNKNALLEEKQDKILAQNNELEKYRNYLEDIVDERTKALLIAKNKAEESDRLKSSFLNNISHEIRTPLNIISGFTALLDDNELENEEKSSYIRLINNNTDSLCIILNEILDVSKIETNQLVLSNSTFNVNEVLNKLDTHYQGINTKQVKFEFVNKSRHDGLEICTDKERFSQIFNNLLNNAYKFTEKGEIRFGYIMMQDSFRFFVSDTGIGIDKAQTDKIYNPFYKIEDNPDILYGGAGIGLTSSKRLVELMGGIIGVESEINKGSEFYFILPLSVLNPQPDGGKNIFKKNFLKHTLILMFTDDAETFEFVNKTLNPYGAKLKQTVSEKDTIDQIKTVCPARKCIVLIDLKLPFTSSFELKRLIKTTESKIPVIALTDYTLLKGNQKITDENFDAYLSKPIKAETLLDEISALLIQPTETK